MSKLEVIAFCKDDIDVLKTSKIDRIELVEHLDKGGLSPNLELIRYAKKSTNIPIRVMIRPHDKGFCYDYETISLMLKEIEQVKSLGCEGVVFGVLTEDNKVNVPVMIQLVEAAKPMKITFHRAIDEIKTVYLPKELEKIESLGIDTILTSFGYEESEKEIRYNILENTKIEVMYGSGLRINNISEIKGRYELSYYHVGTGVRVCNSLNGNISLEYIDTMLNRVK